MPNIRLVDKESKEVKQESFTSTGTPLPRQVEFEGKKYQYEVMSGDTYIYKEFNS